MRVVSLIEDERVAHQILAHLGLPTAAPSLGRARDPPQAEFTWSEPGQADLTPDYDLADPIPDDLA